METFALLQVSLLQLKWLEYGIAKILEQHVEMSDNGSLSLTAKSSLDVVFVQQTRPSSLHHLLKFLFLFTFDHLIDINH